MVKDDETTLLSNKRGFKSQDDMLLALKIANKGKVEEIGRGGKNGETVR